ncbi:hypothetical protein PCASD_18788 [Puccinia coronata f. sp. avenae]|uniref:CCHC-type domain-containing protein n=1 Tax=Puccinia coronata f. sp. avenae TaxID=200324 RepID=A0A2N5T6Q5_9BASI|nr:hypothetical protein PCASD_18788 [Puccinia coronata f. sp. avenae]
MVGQKTNPRRTGKCYNCEIIGHSAKECRKPWTNYKYAPPKANVGETEPINILFIAVKGDDNAEDKEEITFYDPVTAEIKIFGDLGNDGYHVMTGIITANNIQAFSKGSMILDSGASDHMFNNKDDFSNYIKHNGKVEIAV